MFDSSVPFLLGIILFSVGFPISSCSAQLPQSNIMYRRDYLYVKMADHLRSFFFPFHGLHVTSLFLLWTHLANPRFYFYIKEESRHQDIVKKLLTFS